MKCPSCGKRIPSTDRVCKHCKKRLPRLKKGAKPKFQLPTMDQVSPSRLNRRYLIFQEDMVVLGYINQNKSVTNMVDISVYGTGSQLNQIKV